MEPQMVQFNLADLQTAMAEAMTAGLKPLIEELKADPPKGKARGIFETAAPPIRFGRDLSKLKREELKTTELISEFMRAVYRRDSQRIAHLGGWPADDYYRQMGEATGVGGGFLVPQEFRADVIMKLEKVPHIWQRATRMPVGSDKVEMPSEAGSVTWNWTAENATITASSPTFGQVVWTINFLAGLTKASRQLFADSRIDIGDFLSTLYARELGKELDKQFMTGDHSGKPLGIRNAGITQTVAQAGANLNEVDIRALWHTLPSQYRMSATWLAHDSVFKLIEGIKDLEGVPLFVRPGEALSSIYGKPILEQQDIPTNLGGGSNESELWLGDLAYYVVADREEMGTEISTEAGDAFAAHQVWTKLWIRLDALVTLKDAFAVLTAVK